jgi:TonB family protein
MWKLSVSVIAALAVFVPCACLAQVNPQIGKRLSQRFSVEEQRGGALSNRLNSFSTNRQYSKTYDFQLASQNLFDCQLLVGQIRSDVYSLDYDKAAVKLDRLQLLNRATTTILNEDESLPISSLVRESALDENYAPSETTPTLQGPALRAAIGSELSFSERLLNKARVGSPFAGTARSHGQDATPCTDAEDQMVAQELQVEKGRGYTDSGDFFERNSFFSMVAIELRLLHYEFAHEMALKTFVEGQKILSLCSTQYGNSNPASVVVVPGGKQEERPPVNVTAAASEQPLQQQPPQLIGGDANAAAWPFAPTETVKISAAVAASLLLRRTEPVYPPLAQAARFSGTVVLDVFISDAGDVQDVRVISGPSLLQDPAVDAVKEWHYKPYVLNNRPRPVETTVKVTFSLGQ